MAAKIGPFCIKSEKLTYIFLWHFFCSLLGVCGSDAGSQTELTDQTTKECLTIKI